jgi:phosphotransacetylase
VRREPGKLEISVSASGNIGEDLVQRLGHAEVVGPARMGMRRSFSVVGHDGE